MFRQKWIHEWFLQMLERSRFRVESSSLALSKEWALSDGAIRHRSNRFFKIVGAHWESPERKDIVQPFIEQYEIGTLGFLIRRHENRRELLVQAKIEPGNVGIIQLAPTCQATASNASRVHGGDYPPCFEYFVQGDPNIAYESMQSEQGTRFLGKRNRNVLRIANEPVSERCSHKWLQVEEVLDLLLVNHLVNTDARSVLVCSPWEELVGRTPFTRYWSGFGAELLHSLRGSTPTKDLEEVRSEINTLRHMTNAPEIVSLDSLQDWKITDDGVAPRNMGPFIVRQISVEARGREVSKWDQPIVDSNGEGRVDIVCGRIDGTLHFLFRPYAEAGLYHRVELGPTLVKEPGCNGDMDASIGYSDAVVRAECRQSEEGGRFFRDINHYRIVDVGEAPEAPSGWRWLTLAQIRVLLDEDGWFTNEARGVLALLLPWL